MYEVLEGAVLQAYLVVLLQSVVWEIPNIRKGYLVESTEPGEEGALRLKTDGVNLQVINVNSNTL